MERQLTEQQETFVTSIKSLVNSRKLTVKTFVKIGEENSDTYSLFKMWLFEYCMANGIFFLEKQYFIHVGLSEQLCEESNARMVTDAANSISKVLHSVKMLDTVKNVN